MSKHSALLVHSENVFLISNSYNFKIKPKSNKICYIYGLNPTL